MYNIYKVERDLKLKEQEVLKNLHNTDPIILSKRKCKFSMSCINFVSMFY